MDQQILFLINRQWTGPALDWLMAIVSSLSFWSLPLALLFVAVAWFGRFRARAMLAVLTLTLAIGDGLVVRSLKLAIKRPRPYQALADVRQVDLAKARPQFLALAKPLRVKVSAPEPTDSGRSFPSAHTVNNTCAAIVVTAFYRRRGWLLFILPSLVGYSRVYVGAHWPSDVLCSLLLGLLLAPVLLALYQRLWKSWAPRLAPTLFQRHPRLIEQFI